MAIVGGSSGQTTTSYFDLPRISICPVSTDLFTLGFVNSAGNSVVGTLPFSLLKDCLSIQSVTSAVNRVSGRVTSLTTRIDAVSGLAVSALERLTSVSNVLNTRITSVNNAIPTRVKQLSDVSVSTLTDGDILRWNTSASIFQNESLTAALGQSVTSAQHASLVSVVNAAVSDISVLDAQHTSLVSVVGSIRTVQNAAVSDIVVLDARHSSLVSVVGSIRTVQNAAVSDIAILDGQRTSINTVLNAAVSDISVLDGQVTSVNTVLNAAVSDVTVLQAQRTSTNTQLTSAVGEVTVFSATSVNISAGHQNWTLVFSNTASVKAVITSGGWAPNRTVTLVQRRGGAVSVTAQSGVSILTKGAKFATSGAGAVAGFIVINASTVVLTGDLKN